MTLVDYAELLHRTLLALAVGFFFANLLKGWEILRWWQRRSTALLVWPGRKPPYYGVMLAIGVVLGMLILVKAYLVFAKGYFLWPGATRWDRIGVFFQRAIGELMMFTYYGYMLPLSTRIARGLYAGGIWTDTAFMSYDQIGGISWRETDPPTLVVISRHKMLARRLTVPGRFLGEVRRLLRDKISTHAIEMDSGPGLHLGERDARDSV